MAGSLLPFVMLRARWLIVLNDTTSESRLAQLVERVTSNVIQAITLSHDEVSRSSRLVGIILFCVFQPPLHFAYFPHKNYFSCIGHCRNIILSIGGDALTLSYYTTRNDEDRCCKDKERR